MQKPRSGKRGSRQGFYKCGRVSDLQRRKGFSKKAERVRHKDEKASDSGKQYVFAGVTANKQKMQQGMSSASARPLRECKSVRNQRRSPANASSYSEGDND